MTDRDQAVPEPDRLAPAPRRAVSGRDGARLAVTLFTVFKLPGAPLRVDREAAARAVLWLPAVGALLGVIAGATLLAASALARPPAGALLAAALAVGALAVTTRGLHLDGLADTADGLASAAPSRHALDIMRRSDIGPFGVAALVLVLLTQVAALASTVSVPGAAGGGVTGGPTGGAVALVLAAVTGRVAVVYAAGRGIPRARDGGFGALVAGTVSRRARVLIGLSVPPATAALAVTAGPWPAARCACAVAAGLLAAALLRRQAVRRFGGMTGDVFGALIEVAATATLVAFALTARVAG